MCSGWADSGEMPPSPVEGWFSFHFKLDLKSICHYKHIWCRERQEVDTHPGWSNLETLVTLKCAAHQGDMNISQWISLPQSMSFLFLTWSSFIDNHAYLFGKSSNSSNIFWLLVQLPTSNCLLLTATYTICCGDKIPSKFKIKGGAGNECFIASYK